jgi:lipopolysaccharide transport system permease protein
MSITLPTSTTPKSTDSELPVRIYGPEKALTHPWVLLKELGKDLWSGRELAWRLFVRDFKAQYSQTMLGYVWAFLPPLFASLTFVFLQSQGIIKIEGLGIPYAAFAMIGTMLWQTFVESIQSPLQAISSAKPMLAKINFPRESILVAGMYMVLTSTAIRLLLIFGVMLVWGIMPGWSLVLLPFFLFGLMLCGFAVGMAIVPIGGLYGDVARSIPIFAQFWMLLTPVIYPARTGGWAGWLTQWNPVSPLIASARASLTNQPLEQMGLAIGYTILFGLISLMGLIGFRLIMPHLIARMGG